MSIRRDTSRPTEITARPTPPAASGQGWPSRLWQALRDDVWAKGLSGTLQTVFRMLRLLVRWPAHREWCGIVGGPTTRSILVVYPRIVYLHSFSYLFAGTTWSQRLSMASAHYAFLNRMHDAAFFERLIEPAGLTLWREPRGDRVMSIALMGPCLVSRHHEGDLTLALALDDLVLCKIAFSIIGIDDIPGAASCGESASGLAIYIGQVQGAAVGREVVREATLRMHAVAPRDVLICALAGAAEAWRIDRLIGVPGARLLSVEAWRNSSSRFDYERFWLEHGAVADPAGHHVMCLPFAESRCRPSRPGTGVAPSPSGSSSTPWSRTCRKPCATTSPDRKRRAWQLVREVPTRFDDEDAVVAAFDRVRRHVTIARD